MYRMTLKAMRRPTLAVTLMIAAALLPAAPTAGAALVAVSCPYQDNSGGVGGQEGSCTFTCDKTDTIHIKVDAKDKDAMVSGTGQCGGGHLSCGPASLTCGDQNENVPADDTAGTCSGSSDEFIDSGLTVDCWSTDITQGPEEPRLRDIVCHQWPPACAGDPIDVVRAAAGSICQPDQTKGTRPEPSDIHVVAVCKTSGVHIQYLDGAASGFACLRGECMPIVPSCATQGGRLTCAVGPSRA